MGILKGIYRYEKEASSEFSDWVTDVPCECFGYVLDKWKTEQENQENTSEMEEFIKHNFPEWA
ncbi:MAG: hypothetical protein KJ607_05050 [Bacteroidetes bacterium]|nr:hypothetical protein [Bacteroidota bacterium]